MYIHKITSTSVLTRRRKKQGDFFDKLRDKVNAVKKVSSSFSQKARERGPEIGKQLTEKSKEQLENSIATAKKFGTSPETAISLIEKLGKLKEVGLITEEEYQQKKKELLNRL